VLAYANKVQLENIKLVTDGLRSSYQRNLGERYSFTSLNNPTIKEIVDELDAKVLFGRILK
jgi:phosphate acetyltransferase